MADSETTSPLVSDFEIENDAPNAASPFLVVEWLVDRAPVRETAPPVGPTLGEEGRLLGGNTRGKRGPHPVCHTIASFPNDGRLEEARTKIWKRAGRWAELAHSGIERICQVGRLETLSEAEEWSVDQVQ